VRALNRTKVIDSYIGSQTLASAAISLRKDADLVREASERASISRRSAATTVRTLRELADAIEADARAICKETGIELPPDVEERLSESRAQGKKRVKREEGV